MAKVYPFCYTVSMKSAGDHYQEYLSSIHDKWDTADEIIQDLVKEATGYNLKSKLRIIAGESNEVYDLTLDDNTHVILRISNSGHPNFLQEKWAIKEAKKLGIPVPEILLIKYLKIEGTEKSFCLMKKVKGEPLERGAINFDKFDSDLKRKLINQAGEILSKIHSIPTEGFGRIKEEGKAEFKTSSELIDNLVSQQEKVEKMAEEEEIALAQIENAYRIINSFRDSYAKVKPYLNHGDFSHKHFMFDGNKITCILDWGEVRSDSPVYDFACWDYWFGEYIPTEWLKEGYTNKSLFDENFEDFLHMWRLFKGLEVLNWYHQIKYKEAVEKAKVKLTTDLKYFK